MAGDDLAKVPPMDLQRLTQDQPNVSHLRDAIEELDVLAGDILMISQRAAHAATKRGDEIDIILAGIREIRQGITTRAK